MMSKDYHVVYRVHLKLDTHVKGENLDEAFKVAKNMELKALLKEAITRPGQGIGFVDSWAAIIEITECGSHHRDYLKDGIDEHPETEGKG